MADAGGGRTPVLIDGAYARYRRPQGARPGRHTGGIGRRCVWALHRSARPAWIACSIVDSELGTIMRQVGALEHQSDHAGPPHARI